jgi:hypothetical protein
MSVNAAVSQAPPAGTIFSLGWLMAQLYGPLQHRGASDAAGHLPTIAELGEDSQMGFALAELEHLLTVSGSLSGAAVKAAWESTGHEGFAAAVEALHLQVLAQLAQDHRQLSAYELGRALSDTCWLPDKEAGAAFFLHEFDRHRLATLQTWLAEASAVLPLLSAATVSRSLQNWQAWADTNASGITSGWATDHSSVVAALRTQAAAWRALLAGEADTSGQTSIDAWVQAGESILRSTRLLMLAILRRFWPVVIIIAAATGGLIYLAIASSSGTAKVWTTLVTVAAALGVSGASLRAAALKATSGIEHDIASAASLDARAWAATWLPALRQTPLQKYRLANRGVAAPQSSPGLESAPAASVQALPAQPPSAQAPPAQAPPH